MLDCCPYELMRDAYFQVCCYLVACQDVQPLEGFPTRMAAGIVRGIRCIRDTRADFAAKRARQQTEVS